jgi:hypothetical protein
MTDDTIPFALSELPECTPWWPRWFADDEALADAERLLAELVHEALNPDKEIT